MTMTNENPTNILNLKDGGKAKVQAGRDLLFNQAKRRRLSNNCHEQ